MIRTRSQNNDGNLHIKLDYKGNTFFLKYKLLQRSRRSANFLHRFVIMEESYWRIIAGESSKLGFTRSEISCGSSLVEHIDHLSTGSENTVCYMLLLIFYSSPDIDECGLEGQCIDGTCVNTPGSFRCQCPTNYQLDASGRICKGKFHFTLG